MDERELTIRVHYSFKEVNEESLPVCKWNEETEDHIIVTCVQGAADVLYAENVKGYSFMDVNRSYSHIIFMTRSQEVDVIAGHYRKVCYTLINFTEKEAKTVFDILNEGDVLLEW